MKKTIFDERNGWEYELIGDQYYPTGRVMRDGRLQPETVDVGNEPDKDHGRKRKLLSACGCSAATIFTAVRGRS